MPKKASPLAPPGIPVFAGGKAGLGKTLWNQRFLLIASAPFIIWLIIFAYVPLVGWIIAFQDYKPQNGFFGSPWVGLKHFIALFNERLFYRALRNTLGMSSLGIVAGFTFPLVFALLLNELRILPFKRVTQTISYLPHFVSWVIVAGIVTSILSVTGPVNELMVRLGIFKQPYDFLIKPQLFWWIIVLSDVWKETGWGAIIYLAAITGIDAQIYEAAELDGANRLQKIFFVTIPSIRGTIIILLILSIGNLLSTGFERQMLLGNTLVTEKSLVLDLFSLNYGIGLMRYSFGTAIGIFKSVVSLTLVLFANWLARRAGESHLI
jgi:putative aldouronate transport system permease protein